ncbi:DUF1707 domain-containing protein [Kribbella sp. NPDC056861]|uniref:DUF1707 SHOCT-like domain-containing protein n=1 Tax=Kribbella sp. NPDC056861 TaxID=3154857 RepID=UPI0034469BB9
MNDQLPLRSTSLRIGDAERDQAVSLLGEHFVAGRLTQDEFEERSDQATKARYADEVELLFADLPDTETQLSQAAWPPGRAPWAQGRHPDRHPARYQRQGAGRVARGGPPPRFVWILPIMMVGLVVTSVVLTAPWLLWMMFWFAILSGPIRHRRWQGPGHQRR